MKILHTLVLIFLWLTVVNGCAIFLKGYVVHIKSDIINDSVTLRCQSKDDDLGYHVLHSPNLEYEWSFCENFSGSTLFLCHFWWQKVEQRFDVFNVSMAQWCNEDHWEGNRCRWEIKEDGFYFFEPHNYVWLKQYSWKQLT